MSTAPAGAVRFNSDSLKLSPMTVKKDGRVSTVACQQVFRTFADILGHNDAASRDAMLVSMAASLCQGTSADTVWHERYLDAEDKDSCLEVFVQILSKHEAFAGRENTVRLFARSYFLAEPDATTVGPVTFADLTHDVIKNNQWLMAERAAAAETDIQYGALCFDYADAMTYSKGPLQKSVMGDNLRRNARDGRSVFRSVGPSGGVDHGTSPAARAQSTVSPDSDRVSRGGKYSGLYM